ncbi:putative membrane protein [Pseudonocardia sp. Ae168_Ps1]|uniref:antibiotic biosynthesis monooxygenase n=1 Tax=unclassified Pseudonocardia TaxID=2619320 RepID=UPI00094AFF8F|nr:MULTISPECIES: antibiotic biosynthesis monooxygenase [unclassified Pseudonocardia]OLL71984.1 putative membrane protein [Pseudonocardia sp. Ae150A_Ps1]OLL77951.1 putative membrane protein [Pseudonocardia sp. Ae168_Ps1]OLL87926.1 putative membrane protein [Pseudonocardia sp. Ae263_Ps1]OLL92049.1 putative membrane protein [Pseudonocardia sp. Ae356_Ps1]
MSTDIDTRTGGTTPAAASTAPVTVSFTRRADPGHATEMTAWIRSGLLLAEGFPGFLGGGWVRTRGGSDEWHMLARFDSHESLARWEAAPERRWWLGSAQGLAEMTRSERRTGIEGWFDEAEKVETAGPPQPTPPRWKQATTIWLVFFPMNLLATVTLGALLADWHVVPRIAVTTIVLTPIMVYLVLPWITRVLGWWLHGARFRDRHRGPVG